MNAEINSASLHMSRYTIKKHLVSATAKKEKSTCWVDIVSDDDGSIAVFVDHPDDAREIAAAFTKLAQMIDAANGVAPAGETVPGHESPATSAEVAAITSVVGET